MLVFFIVLKLNENHVEEKVTKKKPYEAIIYL